MRRPTSMSLDRFTGDPVEEDWGFVQRKPGQKLWVRRFRGCPSPHQGSICGQRLVDRDTQIRRQGSMFLKSQKGNGDLRLGIRIICAHAALPRTLGIASLEGRRRGQRPSLGHAAPARDLLAHPLSLLSFELLPSPFGCDALGHQLPEPRMVALLLGRITPDSLQRRWHARILTAIRALGGISLGIFASTARVGEDGRQAIPRRGLRPLQGKRHGADG